MPALQRPCLRTHRAASRFILATLTALAAISLLPLASAQVPPGTSAFGGGRQAVAAPAIKQDLKKAKSAYQQGLQAEQKQDWQAAYEAYTNAANWAPDDRDYLLRLELVKSRLIQTKADAAERDAVAGRFDDARRELVEARYLDPTDTVLRDRLAELTVTQSRSTVQSPVDGSDRDSEGPSYVFDSRRSSFLRFAVFRVECGGVVQDRVRYRILTGRRSAV